MTVQKRKPFVCNAEMTTKNEQIERENGSSLSGKLLCESEPSGFGKVATDVITNRANRCSFQPLYDEGGSRWLAMTTVSVGVKQTILNVIVTERHTMGLLGERDTKGNMRVGFESL